MNEATPPRTQGLKSRGIDVSLQLAQREMRTAARLPPVFPAV
jgi:hypothetical protein